MSCPFVRHQSFTCSDSIDTSKNHPNERLTNFRSFADQRLRHSKGSLDVLYFKFSDKIVQHRVTRGELSLWVWGTGDVEARDDDVEDGAEEGDAEDEDGPESSGSAGPVTITLQRILRGSTESGGPLLGPPLTTKHLRPVGRRGAWITIELRRMVAEWFKHPRDNLGVALKISDSTTTGNGNNGNNHRRNSWLVETNPGAEYAPYLEVQTQELDARRGARIKRNVGLNCDETSQETRCCRYKLTVDFEKFGWDWIIAPKKSVYVSTVFVRFCCYL